MARRHLRNLADEIEWRSYRPPPPYWLGVEILSVRDLRMRATAEHLRRAHRIDFHLLIFVTSGKCNHVVDFKPVRCRSGSLLVLRPSQAEQFDVTSDWDGWLVLFRPEFLFLPQLEGTSDDLHLASILASHPEPLTLHKHELHVAMAIVAQMHEDSKLDTSATEVQALLRHQLCALLVRIGIVRRRQVAEHLTLQSELQRFRRFHQLVEQSFAKWHQVTQYARSLGCTEQTLTRATTGVAGITAKAFVVSRINLEAKRLLAHTSSSVASIADSLGFDDPSNFVKFFKRETGCTPSEFRRDHQSL
jgi:AraC-like DNA-binding protein